MLWMNGNTAHKENGNNFMTGRLVSSAMEHKYKAERKWRKFYNTNSSAVEHMYTRMYPNVSGLSL
jgi:hypothetical protein